MVRLASQNFFNLFASFSSTIGKRVIIRDCGEAEVDVCGEEPEKYANTRAEGTLCTCMSDKCNDGSQLTISGILLTAAIMIVIKLTQ